MLKYTSPLCSCVVCKQLKTAKGIHSHYIVSHTEEGKARNRKNRLAGGLKGASVVKQNAQKLQDQYLKEPNKCEQCDTNLTYAQRHNRFCSSTCSALLHNNKRKGTTRPLIVRDKISSSVRNFLTHNPRPQYSKVSFCCECGSVIRNKIVRTCSPKCKSTLLSKMVLDRIKRDKRSNYRRDKKSYLEQSFETWLADNNINTAYKTEYSIKNHITQKWYFVDFYFPEIKLVVELDGKQHERPEHKEADRLRDEYITSYLGLRVFRISYNEYRLGAKIPDLLKLLLQPQKGI